MARIKNLRVVSSTSRRAVRVPRAITLKTDLKAIKKATSRMKLTKPMKSLVLSAVRVGRETKSVSIYAKKSSFNQTIEGSTTGPVGTGVDCYLLLPQVVQGTGDDNRIGNRIKPIGHLVVNGFFYMDPSLTQGDYNAGTELLSGITINAYVCTSKKMQSYDALAATLGTPAVSGYKRLANNILCRNGLEGNYDGSQERALSWKPNTAIATFHNKKKYNMARAFAPAGNANPPGASNTMRNKVPFVFRILLPKFLDYESDLTATPAKGAPLMYLGFTSDQNQAAASATQVPFNAGPFISFASTLKFEDA